MHVFAFLYRFLHCNHHHSAQALFRICRRSLATVTALPFLIAPKTHRGMPWKGQVSFYYSAFEEGWTWALQSSCDKQGRSKKCVTHSATESGKADVDPWCLGESHQSWPGHAGNPVCRRGSAALTAFRGCTGLSVRIGNAWSWLPLKPGKLWVDSGLGRESIYSTQYLLINGCTSHMVFKKHLYQDEKLLDLQPTSKIERQLGVVFLTGNADDTHEKLFDFL